MPVVIIYFDKFQTLLSFVLRPIDKIEAMENNFREKTDDWQLRMCRYT